jgi:hypothetical protein
MIIFSSSNIDIIQGVIAYGDAEGITDWRISNANNGIFNIHNSISQNSRITILENGNVGIGTTNPSSILDVYGDINISGSYKKNNRDIVGDTSNYVLTTSNILLPFMSSIGGFGSNYTDKVGIFGSNYVDRVGIFGSNYTDLSGRFTSNYTDLAGRYTSNYKDLVGRHTSNYVSRLSSGGSSQWTTGQVNKIYYNTSNVGIGTTDPTNKLHIFDNINEPKIIVQNGLIPPFITIPSVPSATTISTTGTHTYMVFTYTTETGGAGSRQTLYNITVPTGGLICDVLMVGGGGAGGRDVGGGGGGGAVLYGTNINIPANTYEIRVGDGATAGETRGKSTTGFGATILGGGCAGNVVWPNATVANSGGSGAGGKSSGSGTREPAGSVGVSSKGTILTNATLYNGNVGGNSALQSNQVQSGGGGGAGGVGGNGSGGSVTATANGGVGILVNIIGINHYWGGGGGGGSYITLPSNGGLGGGGAGERNDGNNVKTYGTVGGSSYNAGVNMDAGASTGGGGGGTGYNSTTAGKGGSGIIIIKIANSILTNSSIDFIRRTPTDVHTDFKVGNFNGDFKIISSISGTDVDYFKITTAGGPSIYNPTGSPNWATTSDKRIKENIEKASYDKCYENIDKLDLYRFNYIKEFNNINKDVKQLGFIAQDVNYIFPKAVSTYKFANDNLNIPDLLSIDITQINYSLYGAVKKLIEQYENKSDRIERIELLLNIDSSSSNVVIDATSSNIYIDGYSSNVAIDYTSSNVAIDYTSSNVAIDSSSSNVAE